jgi:CheY-like chemotaxis protein
MPDEILWRFMVVDDRQADDTEEFIAEHRVFEAPDRVIVEKCTNFGDALHCLNEKRVDLVILDLKDDSIILDDEDKPLAGEEVFAQIRLTRFVPVVFYTAYPEKVRYLENPYVCVVKRGGEERDLRDAIKKVFETGLPRLIRHIEDEQRMYMWDQVQTNWLKFESGHDKTDLAYLLARRLANVLERNSVRRFFSGQKAAGPQEGDDTIHPIEMYIYPPASPKLQAGDILKGTYHGKDGYWIVLTPSCDLEHNKAATVILASCNFLSEQPEFMKVSDYLTRKQDISKSAMDGLEELISNNRRGKNVQPDRFYFLPGTFFLPDLVVDYQSLIQIPREEARAENRITSLDSPFAEACVARFAGYYGRLGTPDLDKSFISGKIVVNEAKRIAEQE